MQFVWLACALAALLSCKSGDDKKPPPKTAEVPVIEAPAPVTQTHANGMARFKEPGVYLDGAPLAVLQFGELPPKLKPVWIEEQAAVPFNAGDTTPRFRVVQQRRYRFSDYFAAMGLDFTKIKELHIYGGNQFAAAVVIPGKNLAMDGFFFRFGGSIWGKPLPVCPPEVGDGKCPDQIGSIAIYMEKEPPRREGGYFYFGDERVEGVAYGETIRGGVRVYLDGPMVTTVKRNKLRAADIKPLSQTAESETYKLIDFLKSQGIDTDTVEEAWLISYERHVEKLNREQLLTVTFVASKGESGEILVGDKQTPTHAITLHTKALTAEDLPKLTNEELEKADG